VNINALPPELQRLVNEPLSEPPAGARGLWKTLAKQIEKLDRVRQQQAEYDLERVRLREEFGAARRRDQQRLAQALANNEAEPEEEAPRIEAEIERASARHAAMTDNVLAEQRKVAELIVRNRDKWQADLQKSLSDAAAVYRAAIVQLEQARQELEELVQVGGWLTVFPQTGGQVQTAYLAGPKLVEPPTDRPDPATPTLRTFNQVRDDLLRDSEQLPTLGPVPPTPEYLCWLQKQNVLLERVDAAGVAHQTPFRSLPPELARLVRWR
jgi:hypothetical protein